MLVAGRAMQGLGLALMPLTMASARDHLPRGEAIQTIAMLSVVGAAGVGLGYPITGFIAEYLDAVGGVLVRHARERGGAAAGAALRPGPGRRGAATRRSTASARR